MSNMRGAESAAERAYTIICDQILNGELEPGQRLTRREMANITGVSIIPVIDALHRLENEGLVESKPYVGSSVVSLSAETKIDRYALRVAVDTQVASMLATRVLRHEVKQKFLSAAEAVDTEIEREERSRSTWELHYQLHLDLVLLTECPSLVEAHNRNHFFLLLEWRKWSHWQQHYNDDDEARSHVWLVNEIFSADPMRAEKAVRRHIAAVPNFPPQLVSWQR
jgi:DNA-binding GntR family transcriptional regulator